jgi:TRAP-type C4-dicarboxylate transport system permease small subunit
VNGVARAYAWFLRALATVAGGILAVMLVAIISDVLIRDFGGRPPEWTVPLVEFGLLYITMMTAPWLVRTKGHILVEALTAQLPPGAQRVLYKGVYFVCLVTCVLFAWYAGDLMLGAWQRNEMDERALSVPSAFIYLPAVVGFPLMAIEFARYLFGTDTMHSGRIAGQDSNV